VSTESSGRLYSAVTKHWAKIASGLVVALGFVEFVWGGLTADSGVEFYLMAWAGTTGGLWFLFEKAEMALSEESGESRGLASRCGGSGNPWISTEAVHGSVRPNLWGERAGLSLAAAATAGLGALTLLVIATTGFAF